MDLVKVVNVLIFVAFAVTCISLWFDYWFLGILSGQVIIVGLIVKTQLMIKGLGKR